jgi:hypothetical protein
MEKVRNRLESIKAFSDTSILNKAFKLAYSELLGDLDLVNNEISRYLKIMPGEIPNAAKALFRKENCSILYYRAEKGKA